MDYLFAESFPARLVREPVSTFALPLAVPVRLQRLSTYDVLDITSGDGAVYLGLHRLGMMRKARATVMRSHGSEHEFGEILRAANAQGVAKMSLKFRARFYGVRLPEVEKSLRWCDRVICCTHREADYLANRLGIEREKFSVVPHGVSEEFSELDGNAPAKKKPDHLRGHVGVAKRNSSAWANPFGAACTTPGTEIRSCRDAVTSGLRTRLPATGNSERCRGDPFARTRATGSGDG